MGLRCHDVISRIGLGVGESGGSRMWEQRYSRGQGGAEGREERGGKQEAGRLMAFGVDVVDMPAERTDSSYDCYR